MSSQRACIVSEFVEQASEGLTAVGTMRGHRVMIYGPDHHGRYTASTGEFPSRIHTGPCDSRGNAIVAIAKRLT